MDKDRATYLLGKDFVELTTDEKLELVNGKLDGLLTLVNKQGSVFDKLATFADGFSGPTADVAKSLLHGV